MPDIQKTLEILTLLQEKTQRREITWSESHLPPGSLITSLPNYSIKIGPKRGGADLAVSIYNDYGKIVASFGADESADLGEVLNQLYQLARTASAKDTELEKVLEELREAS